jgi:regulation of enolase protein 1 (concanavalin A-like superfamily)
MAAEDVTVPGMPMPLRWLRTPRDWQVSDSALTIEAAGGTDWFADPADPEHALTNAPALVARTQGDFVLSARVHVAFAATFDAGVLMLHVDDRCWAKLCFEYSPQGEPMIVSVVTNGSSDDANALVVPGGEAWLRIARIGPAYAFHASTDGARWQLVRHFRLGGGDEARVGFEARRLADLRGGA